MYHFSKVHHGTPVAQNLCWCQEEEYLWNLCLFQDLALLELHVTSSRRSDVNLAEVEKMQGK